MAEASVSWAHDQFSCSVCLDLLKDPVTIPCGHSYCMSCITNCWNQDDAKGVYSCPQCRQTFTERPALGKNTILAEMVEELRNTKLKSAVPVSHYAGPGDVECDICTGRKLKAVKSCLMCQESYCQTHFERHEEFHSGKKHKMTDATAGLKDLICHQHDKLLEIFCRTDQQCICMLCMVDEHKNHDTVSTAAERNEKQKELGESQSELHQQIQEREKKLQELNDAVETHKRSAKTTVEDCERIFTELISSIKRSCSEVTQMIRDREKATVSRAEELLKNLEQETDDLRRRDTQLQQLSRTDDHIHFLKGFQSLSVLPASTDVPDITVKAYDDVAKSVAQLRQKLENDCRQELERISGRVRCIQIIPTPEYESRREFMQYFQQFTLDSNTANQHIKLSNGNKMMTYSRTIQQYPDHPERFDRWTQVLCRESVCRRSYWEIELSDKHAVYLSLSYKSINRKGEGDQCRFGFNDQSWALLCTDSSTHYSFWHNNKETKLPKSFQGSCRVGVYVDHSAGTLSFYSISDRMNLIHRVQTTFTQPLYPGFQFKRWGINLKYLSQIFTMHSEIIGSCSLVVRELD